jgi:hypothetical protein
MPVVLFQAFRVGDTIPSTPVPCGTITSKLYKAQLSLAKNLLDHRLKLWIANGRRGPKPNIESCMPSRDPQLYWQQCARLSLVIRTLFSRRVSLSDASYATGVMERLCCELTRMNIHLTPSFHQALHVEDTITQFGALQNSWVWGFERANRSLSRTNKNGQGHGVMERTMMRRWWKAHQMFGMVSCFVFRLTEVLTFVYLAPKSTEPPSPNERGSRTDVRDGIANTRD